MDAPHGVRVERFLSKEESVDQQIHEVETTSLTLHPLMDLIPAMQQEEWSDFFKDVQERDIVTPLDATRDNVVLDGRHRLKAAKELGLAYVPVRYVDTSSPVAYMIKAATLRRQLSSSQRAMIAVEALPELEAEAKKRQGARNDLTSVKIFTDVEPERSSARAAEMFGTNAQYVSDAKRIKAEAPELAEQVRTGEMPIYQAKRELKERKREAIRAENRQLVAETAPVATATLQIKYQTIVLDPPWDWGDEGDQDQLGRSRPTYATMSIDEIEALPIADLATQNAHIYLWITNRSLPKGFRLLEAWGFRYITMLTWVKPSFGMGNYFRGSTEQVLFGVRGSLALLRRDVATHFNAARPGPHSGKPDEFYNLVETCSPGPWLELFSRQERNGWARWGAEA